MKHSSGQPSMSMPPSGTFLQLEGIKAPHSYHAMEFDAPKLSFAGEIAPVNDEA